MTNKNELIEQLKEMSEELQKPYIERLKKLERNQLGESFEGLSQVEEIDKVFKLEYEIEKNEEFEELESVTGKIGKALKLLKGGIGPLEPDEDFVPEPTKVKDEEAIQKLSEQLENVDVQKIIEMKEEEVERLKELLEEFFSHAD